MPKYNTKNRLIQSYEAAFEQMMPSYKEQSSRFEDYLDDKINGNYSRSRTANTTVRHTKQEEPTVKVKLKLEESSNLEEYVKKPAQKQQASPNSNKPVRGKYPEYNTPRPNTNYDALAFTDAIVPSILDPNYGDWVKRQQARAIKNGIKNAGSGFVQNINNSPFNAAISSAVALYLAKRQKLEEQATRLQRRLFESQLPTGIKKDLTNQEVKDIITYKMMTDDSYFDSMMDRLNDISEASRKEQLKLISSVQQPDDYYNMDGIKDDPMLNNPLSEDRYGRSFSYLARLISSKWNGSVFSKWMWNMNNGQIEKSIGKILRTDELSNLASNTLKYIDITKKIAENYNKIQRLYAMKSGGKVPAKNISNIDKMIGDLQQESVSLRKQLSDSKLNIDANRLASWELSPLFGRIDSFIDGIIGDNIGGVRGKLYGIGSSLDSIQKLMNQNDYNDKWHSDITKALDNAGEILNKFQGSIKDKLAGWKNDILTDVKDLEDWKTGNNKLGFKLHVDDYYKAQEQLLLMNNYDWSDPAKMAMFGWSGIAGSSASSWYKLALSLGANIAGFALSGGSSMAVNAAVLTAAIGTSYGLNKSAGYDENNMEAANAAMEDFKSRMKSNGVYEDFIKDGERVLLKNKLFSLLLKTLDDENDKEHYILQMYMSGLWQSKIPQARKDLNSAVIGTNNLFYNDEPVNTMDAAVDAVLSTARLAPIKQAVKSTTVTGRLIRRTFNNSAAGRALSNVEKAAGLKFAGVTSGIRGVGKKVLESNISNAIQSGAIKLADAASKVGGKVKNLSHIATQPVRPIFLGVERNIANQLAHTREFATRLPKAYLDATTIAKHSANIGGRLAGESLSEALQEGVQGINLNKYQDRQYDVQQNRATAFRIMDDAVAAGDAVHQWFNQFDPAYVSDPNVVGAMNSIPLLTLFGPGAIGVMVQAYDGVKEMKLNDIVWHNLDVAKRGETAQIKLAYEYARRSAGGDKKVVLDKFNQFANVVGIRNKAIDDINGLNRLKNGSSAGVLIEDGQRGIPVELIEDLKKVYEDIVALTNSKLAHSIAKKAGISDKDIANRSEKYSTLISLLDYRINKQNQAVQELAELDKEISEVFGNLEIYETLEDYDEDDVYINNDVAEKLTVARSITKLAMLYELDEDYSLVQLDNKGASPSALTIKKSLKELKEKLKTFGIDINSKEEAILYLQNSEYGSHLYDMVQFAKIGADSKVSSIHEMSIEDIVNGVNQYLRQRFIKEYNASLQASLLNDFLFNPNEQIRKYNEVLEQDAALEQILTEDYANSVNSYTQALLREVKDGDIYVGNDGKWYVVNKKQDESGNEIYVKHEYDPTTKKVGELELKFNRFEYNRAKTAYESAVEELNKRRKANLNLASTSESSSNENNQQEPPEQTNGTTTETLPGMVVDVSTKSYKSGQDVIYNNNGDITTATVIGYKNDGSVMLQDAYGNQLIVQEDAISTANIPSYDPTYVKGDVVNYNGKKYVVLDSLLEDVDEYTFQPTYRYQLLPTTGGEIIEAYNYDITPSIVVEETNDTKVVSPNQIQTEIIDRLEEKRKADVDAIVRDANGNKVTTRHNYFIRIKDKIVQFVRVHGILDDIFEERPQNRALRLQILTAMQDLLIADIELLKLYIEDLQLTYGEDLSMYTTDEALADLDTPVAVSSIIAGEKPGVAVVVGSIIDRISREYFSNQERTAVNRPEYKMNDDVFAGIIKQLDKLNKYFVDLGWVVDVTPYTWYSQMQNGIRIAGETDMIAIDKEGKVHILDFKTTRSSTRFIKTRQIKSINPVTNEESWVLLPFDVEPLEGDEVRTSMPFIDQVAPSQEGRGKRSYAAQYAMLLEAYRQMIQNELGLEVASLQVIPFSINYSDSNEELVSINSITGHDLINLSSIEALQPFILDVDNMLLSETRYTESDVKDRLDALDIHLVRLDKLLEDSEKLLQSTIDKIVSLINQIKMTKDKLNLLLDSREKLNDIVYSKQIILQSDNIDDVVVETERLHDEDVENYLNNLENNEQPPVDGWENGPLEPVTDSLKLHWWQFNNLHSMSAAVTNMKNYMESIINRDFIKNSTFKVTRDSLGIFHVTIEYRPAGKSPIKFKLDITIRLGNDNADPLERNRDWIPGKESVMARNLIRQYVLLFDSLKPGEYIIAKNVKRTNGKLQYDILNPAGRSLLGTQFLDENDERLLTLLNGSESIVGIVNESGSVFEVTSGNREIIMYPSQDIDGNLKQKTYEPKPGNFQSEGIPAGSVVFLHKFKNEEDAETDEVRVVPVVLRGRKLSDKDINLIVYTISNYNVWNTEVPVRVTYKDGTISESTIPGLTYQKAMKLLVRFGDQAIFAGDDFVFGYAVDENLEHISGHKKITITDMLADPVEGVDEGGNQTFKRPIITLDLQEEPDIQRLREILKAVDIHINQIGIMSTNLNNSDESSWVGALGAFFKNEENSDVASVAINGTLQFDAEDVLADKSDINKGLTVAAWQIKHGISRTNAIGLSNPLISITDLEKSSDNKARNSENNSVTDSNTTNIDIIPEGAEMSTTGEGETIVENNNTEHKPKEKKVEEVTEADIDSLLGFNFDGNDGFGMDMKVLHIPSNELSESEKSTIRKRMKRLLGNFGVQFLDKSEMLFRFGAGVVGRMALDSIYLSNNMVEGTEYHESFHRIFELLVPSRIRESMYEIYRQRYDDGFRRLNGRVLTERDIAEAFAEMFRDFMTSRKHIKLHLDITKTFREIKQYIQSINKLGDRRFAALFIAANSGIFRFFKPSVENIERFGKVFGSGANMKIYGNVEGKNMSFDLTQFPEFGGRVIYNDAINGLVYSLIRGYSIDAIANNASKISTRYSDITNNLFRGNENTEHSTWFRVLTGEYANDGETITAHDAYKYSQVYKNTEHVRQIAANVIKANPGKSTKEIYPALLNAIMKHMAQETPETINQNQKMMAQLLSKEAWPIVRNSINKKLEKLGIDSQMKYEPGKAAEEESDDESMIHKSIEGHKEVFYDHDRSDDASAAVRFLLSTVPDEHFATQDDVDAGVVTATVDADGNPVLVANSTNLLGYRQFLNMKTVSNKLLLACNDVNSAEELDQRLQKLAEQDPVFYRISRKYHAFLVDSVLKTEDGKNVIYVGGKQLGLKKYEQHYDENGVYYTFVKDGVDTGNRIKNAQTKVNVAKESFVTLLFNYVSCQRLDFIQVVLDLVFDEDGNEIEGKYTSRVLSNDSNYAATILPREWFVKFRSGVSGIFTQLNSGRITVTEEGLNTLTQSITWLNDLYKHYVQGKQLKIGKKQVDRTNTDDFRSIQQEFIKCLNTLGIDITKEQLESTLKEYYKTDQLNMSLLNAFANMLTSALRDLSYKAFLEMLANLANGITVNGKNEILTNSQPELTKYVKSGKSNHVSTQKASGINLYQDNAFIKWLSQGVSRYNKLTKQLMTNGPGNTKQYTMAQSHTASDITQDINNTTVGEDGNVSNGVVKDMLKYSYNFGKRIVKSAQGIFEVKIGSLILKHVLTPGRSVIKLKTSSGVRVFNDFSGGVAYNEITEREDYLAKMAILLDGGIIFPTLSDKSTWFYLSGVSVPGLNYRSLSSTSPSNLLHLGLHKLQNITSSDVHITFDFNRPNEQLDLMIEYAICERNLIEKELARVNVPNIKSWKANRTRFGGLTEVVTFDQNGNKIIVSLNNYDMTPEECLKLADTIFFGDHITTAQRRQMMAMTLELGFLENLALLEHTGLIVANNNLEEVVIDERGNPTKNTRPANRLFLYENVGLDSNIIDLLTSIYLSEVKREGLNITRELYQKAHSLAIAAYVWDTYLRGLISNEEVERIYTGAPQFFKWTSKKIKDVLSGKVMNVLVDRHSDQSKRLGGLGSTGEKNRIGLPDISSVYKCAEIKDLTVASLLYEDLKQSFIDNEIRQAYLDYKQQLVLDDNSLTEEQRTQKLDELNDLIYTDRMSLEDIKKELDEYKPGTYDSAVAVGEKNANAYYMSGGNGNINVADGAAYITPEMTRNLLRSRGVYTDEVREAFEYLSGKRRVEQSHGRNRYVNPLKDRLAYRTIMNALIGAQKYSAYGYRFDPTMPDVPIHYYDKFALFPLFETMATGFTQKTLLKMREDGVDMLMMDSAVKTGSQDASDFNENTFSDEQSFKDFHFKTYQQKYAFIRRQLNTDPHDHNETQMGTQMTKVALSNLNHNRKYTLADGSVLRGRDLLKLIMDSINALSDLGLKDLKKLFYTDDKFDFDKFGQFLREELESRDADENLINGVEIITLEDGTKDFKVPLEAMSSVDWIQSILISKINKSVIDITIDGNAFYQRSVWGVEGNPTVLLLDNPRFKTASINNGRPLKMINNDGSMDAVISIDYYYDVIPEEIRYNFTKARQWLIDNNIIGQNAKADTIASRIPTLAQSSIHALRFVDVLPVVRSTIVLPKEFTAITGSDFDIDKLYLSRKSYRVQTTVDGEKKTDIVSTQFDLQKSPLKYHRNKLLDSYLVLLKDHGKYDENGNFVVGNSANISLRSIDDDTNLIKSTLRRIESVNNEDEQYESAQRYYAYKFGNLAFLVRTKSDFITGKFGIGPFALNNNNLILTQLYGVKFNAESAPMLRELGCTDLSKPKDKKGISKLSWLSGFINANVDVAKDPYISRLNINKFTYNVVNLLIRTGMSDRTLMFTSQPVMKELARVYNDASGSFMNDQTVSTASRQRAAIKEFLSDTFDRHVQNTFDGKFINEMMDENNPEVEMQLASFAKAIFGIDDNGNMKDYFDYVDASTGEVIRKSGSILEDILTNKDVLNNINEGVSLSNLSNTMSVYQVSVKDNTGADINMTLTPLQVLLYVAFINNQLSKYGQKLSDLVNVCKIDTKKHGKSYVEQKAFMQKYNTIFENEDGTFENEGLLALRYQSYIETKTKNAVDLYEEMLLNASIQATDQFLSIHDRILPILNSTAENKELSKKVSRSIMTYIKTKFFDGDLLVRLREERQNENYGSDLFYGGHTVLDYLIRLLNMLKRDTEGEYKVFARGGVITNPLLKALQSDLYKDKADYNNPKFIKLEGALLDDTDNTNAIQRAWDDLYRDDLHYIKIGDRQITFKQFAVDLAVYAYYTSGDTQGQTKFFKYVPNTIREGIGYSEYIRNISQLFQNGTYTEEQDIIHKIIADNWQDKDFVKEVRAVLRKGKSRFANIYVGGTVETQYARIVRQSSKRFVTKKMTVRLNTIIAAYRKTLSGTVVTVRLTNDGYFPAYIKIRNAQAEKFNPDSMLLYELADTGMFMEGGEQIVYPIYKLVLPKTSKIRAGSYNYEFIRPDGAPQSSYSIHVGEAIETIFGGNAVVQDANIQPSELISQFVSQLLSRGIVLDKEYIYDLLSNELEKHNISSDEKSINALSKAVENKLKATKQEDLKQRATKSTRIVIRDSETLSNSGVLTSNYESGISVTESSTTNYAQRTKENAAWSDITLALAIDFATAGEKLTKKEAGNKYVSASLTANPTDIVEEIIGQIKSNSLPTANIKLNIAGNGIYSLKDKLSQQLVDNILLQVLQGLRDNGIDISEIRSGGQTGVDEAGVKAGMSLGIKTSIHTTKGFKFRDINGNDISDKLLFMERFKPTKEQQSNTLSSAVKVDSNKLSNVYIRPFEKDGIRFLSVYQAVLYDKLQFANASAELVQQARQDVLSTTDTNAIRAIMNRFLYEDINTINEKLVNSMLDSMYMSFKQNPEIMSLLLATGISPINVSTPAINQMLMLTRETLMKELQDLLNKNREFDDEHMRYCKGS